MAVGLSGGVDSALAAALLKEEGHEVIGVIMKIWDGRPLPQEDGRHACYGPGENEDVEDAARVADTLGIPFHVVDLAKEFNERVLDFSSSRYQAGVTPNPCVICNRWLKFHLLPEALRKCGIGFDRFATGHYAIVSHDEKDGRYLLRKGRDLGKDQSYFLYLLTQNQLAKTLFPLGNYTKAETRRQAENLHLPVATKRESQEFVSGGYKEIFNGKETPGPILDAQEQVLGTHRGIHLYTIGQRRGLGVASSDPLYVTSIDQKRNAVIVGREEHLYSQTTTASAVNWISIDELKKPMNVSVRVRYGQKVQAATMAPSEGGTVKLTFDEPQRAIAAGQAAVFYDGDIVIGGGTIDPPPRLENVLTSPEKYVPVLR